jgi:enamine deaminase RidA (YjgF/YER057c/UK114 family)
VPRRAIVDERRLGRVRRREGAMPREGYNLYDELYERKRFTWSDAVRKGRFLVISGTTATDADHRSVHEGDLRAQTRHIYEAVAKLLEKAGASFDDVVKTTDYVVPRALPQYAQTAEIRREFFKGDYPAATGVVVHSLLRPEWLIEIEFTAVLD